MEPEALADYVRTLTAGWPLLSPGQRDVVLAAKRAVSAAQKRTSTVRRPS